MAIAPLSALEVTLNGVDIAANLVEVYTDGGTNVLEEVTVFDSQTPTFADANANWDTYFSVKLGVHKKSSGNWEIYIYPVYGSPYDEQSPLGKSKPFYSRDVITVTISGTDINIDSVLSAEVIGNGQGIPPTVVLWNPDTASYVSHSAGTDYAFVESIRIQANPNDTGFGDDGEFILRYDHTVDDEGRDFFYPAAGWPCTWVEKDGSFTRGDIPKTGHSFGFCCGEEGPYARPENFSAPNYQIEHIVLKSWGTDDSKQWDNSWKDVPRESRGTSGISPFGGNIVSRGSTLLLDFGYAWILKKMAACQLQMWPSPVKPHTSNQFMYNYDGSSMRSKGRILGALLWLWLSLGELKEVRTSDAELNLLHNDVGIRFVEILNLLKIDYSNGSWQENGSGPLGPYTAWWELGHYFQELVYIQETIQTLTGSPDTLLNEMMVTFAAKIHEKTVEWVNNGPHPLDSTVTYTGGVNGWYLPYWEYHNVPGQSVPTTGIGPKLIICYEWAKANGHNLGAKQDAIIAQYASVNYKWKLGSVVINQLRSIAATVSSTVVVPISSGTANRSIAITAGSIVKVQPTIAGGGKVRLRTALAISDVKSIGTAITLGTGASINLGTKALDPIIYGDDFIQPFTITLDQSRTLDGTEGWDFSVRDAKSDALLMSLSKSAGSITIDGSNQPQVVFSPAAFANMPNVSKTHKYDLQMTKDGKRETYAIDDFPLISDVTRT